MKKQANFSRRQILQAGAAGFVGIAAMDLRTVSGMQDPENPLFGTLEGPEVVTDPSQFPATFQEAPQLAEMVEAGTLPPVQERIGQDPLVIEPVHEIGQYGGTWRRGFTGPGDTVNGDRAAAGPDRPLYFDYTGQNVVPNIARDWEVSDDGRQLTLHLRRGMRWSDGHPFTADDWVFWFEDMYGNDELMPTKSSVMSINGKPGQILKGDDYTVIFQFEDPYYLLPTVLAGWSDIGGGHASLGGGGNGCYAPAHYLKQFHPKYTSEEELNRIAEEAEAESWVDLFLLRNDWPINPDLPVVALFRTVSPINSSTWSLERNPYSIWVDTDGNQLPYIDEVVMTLAQDLEVLNLRAIAGEYDFQARHVDIAKLPVFLGNQEQGGYKVHLDTGDYGTDCQLAFNLSYEADAEIAKWISTTDFRRALSLGVERDQLNEIFWLGTGTPGSPVPASTNKYYPGEEYRTLWHTHDPERANQMLDDLGLTEKDGEGFRQRTDGQGRLSLEITTNAATFMSWTAICEAISQQWYEIGVDLRPRELDGSLIGQIHQANEHQMHAWVCDGGEHLFNYPNQTFAYSAGNYHGPLYGLWFQTEGAQGKEPPRRLRELYEKFRAAYGVPEEESIELAKDIWTIIVDEVYQIGTVGLSPAAMGVRIAKTNMGNVPSRQYNSPDVLNPGISRPATFYYKN